MKFFAIKAILFKGWVTYDILYANPDALCHNDFYLDSFFLIWHQYQNIIGLKTLAAGTILGWSR